MARAPALFFRLELPDTIVYKCSTAFVDDPLDFPLNFEPRFWSGREHRDSVYRVSILHIRQFDPDRVVVKMYCSDIARVSGSNQLTIP